MRAGERLTRPLTFDDVDRYLRPHILEHTCGETDHDRNSRIVADRLGTTKRNIHRWRHQGLTRRQADRIATRLGVHPSWIFTNWDGDPDQLDTDTKLVG